MGTKRIQYKEILEPKLDCTNEPVLLSDKTMEERYRKVISRMQEESLDTLIIYADVEHGSNFEYLTGFIPRFEEALLVVHVDGRNYMLMGNENLNKVEKSRLKSTAIHVPYFSLPNQPMIKTKSLKSLLLKAEIEKQKKIGIVGWKNFTNTFEDNSKLFDVPGYILDEVRGLVENEELLINATYVFIGEKGVRCRNNVNEIEHYEFGASLASDCMLKAMNKIAVGISEMELGNELNAYGQYNSVVTIAAAGKRFEKANIYPTNKQVKEGDAISLTVGYKGGLSSRAGYAYKQEKDLPTEIKDYIEVVVKPYFNTIVSWLENVHCGMKGKEIYSLVDVVLPKETYNWTLCPGHLTADEEWMSSPIYEGSEEILESGMLFQTDIIPSVQGYSGTSAESTILLADNKLQKKIANEAPQLWKRIMKRKEYIRNELGIDLNADILPMCSSVAYLRPLLLSKNTAMCVKKNID